MVHKSGLGLIRIPKAMSIGQLLMYPQHMNYIHVQAMLIHCLLLLFFFVLFFFFFFFFFL